MKKFLLIILGVQMAGLVGCANTPRSRTVYQYPNSPGYYSQPVYAQSQPSAQDEYNKKILKQGILGAATGAIAAEASGGKAGTGALVGAGTNVIGGALIDTLTATPQQTLYQQAPNTNRIVRKFDSNGVVISEEVFTR